jgi:uncharacterized membrane protein (DUF2068 family)
MTRSNRTAIAAILVFFYCLANLIRLFVAFINQSEWLEVVGYGGVAMGLILFTIGLVSAYGIWQNQRWGKITAIVVLTLNALAALPGILFTTTFVEGLEPIMAVLVAVIVVVLLLWPTPQSSTA